MSNLENFLKDMCKGKSAEWLDGFIKGAWAFAHWKDGEQYVGTTGTTYKEVVEIVKKIAKGG